MVYQHAGELEAAEDAYRKSLAIKVRLGRRARSHSRRGPGSELHGAAETLFLIETLEKSK